MEIPLVVLAHQHAKLLELLLSCTQPMANKFHAESLATFYGYYVKRAAGSELYAFNRG